MELRAERGRALVTGAPDGFEPSAELTGDLDEWAEVVAVVCEHDEPDPDAVALVTARGRRLAARLAAAAGTSVGYTDPAGGAVVDVAAPPHDVRTDDEAPPVVTPVAEPTPWATGLTVSAFVAVITLAAVVTLVRGLAELGWLLGVLGLAVVTAGLGPSIWLARHTPLWRWVAYGAAAGLAVSWLSSALASLGG